MQSRNENEVKKPAPIRASALALVDTLFRYAIGYRDDVHSITPPASPRASTPDAERQPSPEEPRMYIPKSPFGR